MWGALVACASRNPVELTGCWRRARQGRPKEPPGEPAPRASCLDVISLQDEQPAGLDSRGEGRGEGGVQRRRNTDGDDDAVRLEKL